MSQLYVTWSDAVAHAKKTIPTLDMRVSGEAPDAAAAREAFRQQGIRELEAAAAEKERKRAEDEARWAREQAEGELQWQERHRLNEIHARAKRIIAERKGDAVVLKSAEELERDRAARELARQPRPQHYMGTMGIPLAGTVFYGYGGY